MWDGNRNAAIEQTNTEARLAAAAGAKIERLGEDGVALNMDVSSSPGAHKTFRHGQLNEWVEMQSAADDQ